MSAFEPGCECTWYDNQGDHLSSDFNPECPVHGTPPRKPFLELRNLNADAWERDKALMALRCPFYNSFSGCGGGCYEEPMCQAEEPEDGWELPVPYGLHILAEVAEEAKAKQERERIETWLRAEEAWLRRPILESTQYSRYGGIPRDIPNGVYPVNPALLEHQAKADAERREQYSWLSDKGPYEPKPWIVLRNSDGGGFMGQYATREEAEEAFLLDEAKTRNFWEEKVEWRENGDKTTPSYYTIHGTTRSKLRDKGGAPVLRIDHRHYVPRKIWTDREEFKNRSRNGRDHKGFAGRELAWRYLDEQGQPTGPEHYSDDVFTQGSIPEEFYDRLPDNAVFVTYDRGPSIAEVVARVQARLDDDEKDPF
ncbi:hypothetical protein SEA_SKOG_89 [Gordonia phage Skog]|uniref:Uncharacterized protein n=1 Tax=Gordonia phage Skog TaxID=2704033 RepID=A0A6G6XJF5_9CAUD|nr:hypothetical protein KHQ85_gp089 [Gordonia phage Skog]QIG58241.1 hypothetical protein SEA_SKOG_89 [Gordonia phage Skog]